MQTKISYPENQIQCVTNFNDLVSTPFYGKINTICWTRKITGDFSEIVKQVEVNENMVELNQDVLHGLKLSDQGQLAREIILKDLELLKAQGAAPTLNLINSYERDNSYPFFPTDVYSFHIDRSPIPVDTFLCTYYGAPSEILPNSDAIQKVLIPEIRDKLKEVYRGADEDFESFLSENFFDLHYQAKANTQPVKLGVGHLCKLAIEHPKRKVPPCLHRAPKEENEQKRLLLIC